MQVAAQDLKELKLGQDFRPTLRTGKKADDCKTSKSQPLAPTKKKFVTLSPSSIFSQDKSAPSKHVTSSSSSSSRHKAPSPFSNKETVSSKLTVKCPERLILPEALFYPVIETIKPTPGSASAGASERSVDELITKQSG